MPKVLTTNDLREMTMSARKFGLNAGLENDELAMLEEHAIHVVDQAVHVGLYNVRCVMLLRQKGIVEPMQRTIDMMPADYNLLKDIAVHVGDPQDFDASDGNAG